MTPTYTCTGCERVLDPDELAEHGHVCDGWWDDHSVYDELPKIAVGHGSSVQEHDHGPDWSDWGIDHPEEGPSCRCGFNGSPEECATSRSSDPSLRCAWDPARVAAEAEAAYDAAELSTYPSVQEHDHANRSEGGI